MKSILFRLLKSYIKFTEKEYKTNSSYNNSYESYKAEKEALDFLVEKGLFSEFMEYKSK